jgi:hypothetical protein
MDVEPDKEAAEPEATEESKDGEETGMGGGSEGSGDKEVGSQPHSAPYATRIIPSRITKPHT